MTHQDPTQRLQANKQHWEATLDAQNLQQGETVLPIEQQVELFATADVRRAIRLLRPLGERIVLDLGGGLGLGAILLARAGARVVIADISLPRLNAARQTLESLGLADRVTLVVARAESLPFKPASIDRVFTKSVLIHTQLEPALRELHRILTPSGTMALIEPTTGNPFVALYRRLLGPGIWAAITTYFGPRERAIVASTLPDGRRLRSHPYFLFAFFASIFGFAWPSPRLHRIAESTLVPLDRIIFRMVPPTRRMAWFLLHHIRHDRRQGTRP